MKQTKQTAKGHGSARLRRCKHEGARMKRARPVPALKTCPFCGGAAVLQQQPASPPEVERPYWTITCKNDALKAAKAGGFCPGMPMAIHEDLDEACKRWNTRVGERGAS